MSHLSARGRFQEFYLSEGNHNRVPNLDKDFHRLLFGAANKMRIYEMMCALNVHFDRFRPLRLGTGGNLLSGKRLKLIAYDHRTIWKAIRMGDTEYTSPEKRF